jgi:hypothetical protein
MNFRHCCVAIAALLLISNANAQPSDPTPEPPSEVPTFLAWEDKFFARNDAALADLILALKELLPVSAWQPVTATEQQRSLWKLIDNYYDIYGTTPDDPGFPKSAALLVELIRYENDRSNTDLMPGDQIRIPPLPVLAQRRAEEFKNIIRFFDHENHKYAITEDLYRIPKTGEFALIDAVDLKVERAAYMTVVRVRKKEDFNGAFSAKFLHDYRRHLLVWEGTGASEEVYPALVMTLFDDPEPTNEEPPPSVFPDNSPYLEAARQRALAMTSEERTAAIANAETRPLVLVDWNFDDGHGRQVRAVVDVLLERLGLEFLATEKSIIKIDLDRTRASARDTMLTHLAEYRDSKGLQFDSPFSSVERWIRNGVSPQVATSPIQHTDSLVLAAIFWKYFVPKRAFMNFSFGLSAGPKLFDLGLENPADPEAAANLLVNPKSVCFVAAGNDKGSARPLFPQTVGQTYHRNFINVTFGTDKEILGSTSTRAEDNYRLYVPLLAPGTGFADRAKVLKVGHSGSSLAAPYVAASAWIEYALDKTSPLSIRKELMKSTRPVLSFRNLVTSAGIFDPGLLLGPRTPHVVYANRQVGFIGNATVVRHRFWGPPKPIVDLNPSGVADTVLIMHPCNSENAASTTIMTDKDSESVPLCVSMRRYQDDDQATVEEEGVKTLAIQMIQPDGTMHVHQVSVPTKSDSIVEIWGTAR